MKGYAYIATNRHKVVLYVGVTSSLKDRIYDHKTKKYPNSFSAKYNIDKLVYYDKHNSMHSAIKREKQLKAGSRQKKIDLINELNPDWRDLYDTL